MQRRFLLAAMAAAAAAPGLALADDVQRIPLAKAFKYLDSYLALAPQQRSHFYLVFRALRNERPAPDLKAAIVSPDGASTPLPLDAQAQVTRLPTLAQLKSDDALQVWGGPFRFATEMRPDIPPSTRLDVAQLQAALAQTTAAVAKIAGAFAAMAPTLDTVLFPDAGSGQVLLANGKTSTLPVSRAYKVLGPVLYFETAQFPGARTVVLARAPSRLILSAKPKS